EYVGLGERLLRECFSVAKAAAPCILGLDEIDSVGRRFTSPRNSTELHCNTTTNQLLTLLSESHPNLIIIATTNNYDMLDKALIRAGRFDRHIMVPLPDQSEREQILKLLTKNKKLHANVSLQDLATI